MFRPAPLEKAALELSLRQVRKIVKARKLPKPPHSGSESSPMTSARQHPLKKGQATAKRCRFLSHASGPHRRRPASAEAQPVAKEVLPTTSFHPLPGRALRDGQGRAGQGRNAAREQRRKQRKHLSAALSPLASALGTGPASVGAESICRMIKRNETTCPKSLKLL